MTVTAAAVVVVVAASLTMPCRRHTTAKMTAKAVAFVDCMGVVLKQGRVEHKTLTAQTFRRLHHMLSPLYEKKCAQKMNMY